jgi:hypothetical protein
MFESEMDTFVVNRAVAGDTRQRSREILGGSQDIIEQPELAQIHRLSKVDPKKIVFQSAGDLVEELNLTFHRNPNVRLPDLMERQRSVAEQGKKFDSNIRRARIGGSCDPTARSRKPIEAK